MKNAFRLCAEVLFDRKIVQGDYISPGGYEFVMNGRPVQFDFEDTELSVDEADPKKISYVQKNPDHSAFEDLTALTLDDLLNVEKIEDFFVYTGEDETNELSVKEVLDAAFVVITKSGDFVTIPVPKHVLRDYNKKLAACL